MPRQVAADAGEAGGRAADQLGGGQVCAHRSTLPGNPNAEPSDLVLSSAEIYAIGST